MTINEDDLLAAVSGALDGTTQETNDDAGNTNDAGTDAGADTTGAGDEAAVDDGQADVAEDSADDGAAPDDAAAEEDAEGEGEEGKKPVAKAGEEELGEDGKPLTPEQKKAKEEAANADAAKKDPINAPISQYLKPATQERMRALVDIAKNVTAERDHYKNQSNEIIGMIQETGANAQQYSQALQYLGAVNSRDPVKIREAKAFLQSELEHLSRMTGEAIPGVNGYEQHADLKAAVAAGLSAEVANELAAVRAQKTWQTTSHQQQQQTQQQQLEAQQREHDEGRRALNTVGKNLAAKDPNYAKKAPAVLNLVSDQLKVARPSEWAQIFLTAYSTYRPPAPPAPKKPPARQPLRGNNPAGGQQPKAGSVEEAINLGIARAGR